ncbi:MAG TPA: ABC transporter permease [Holophaga sp.]|nr:ABC transporter permease [Holophaga sp.]HPS67435.1 ABC transporter permease [Holophaga sp.]
MSTPSPSLPDTFDATLFEPIQDRNSLDAERIVRPCLSYWQDAWIRLRKNKIAMLGICLIALYVAMAVIGPSLGSFDFKSIDENNLDQAPSALHWFGTDTLGRDIWARVWVGARVSLSIGFLAASLNALIGVCIGGVAGHFGGRTDMIIMRIIDVVSGIPYLIVAILVMVALGEGISPLIIAMIIIGWVGSARLVRGQILQLKNQEYVLAARKLGASDARIIFRHLIPNTIGLILTNVTMAVPYAIFTEAFLSYIGLGVQPPNASWGLLARYGSQNFRFAPWQLFIPSFFICTTMLSLYLLGDGLRDALDPKLRR